MSCVPGKRCSIMYIFLLIGSICIGSLAGELIETESFDIDHGKSQAITERVFASKRLGLVSVEVPEHMDIEKNVLLQDTQAFVDTNNKIIVQKNNEMRTCYVMDLDDDESKSYSDLTSNIRKMGFAQHEKSIRQEFSVIPRGAVEDKDQLAAATKLCGTYSIVKGEKIFGTLDSKKMEEIAKEELKKISVSFAGDVTRKHLYACTEAKTMKALQEVTKCGGDWEKVTSRCRVAAHGCIFLMTCKFSNKTNLWNCGKIHNFNSFMCCEYECSI